MLMGPPLDQRAHAILMLRLLADRAEDTDVPLETLGEIARQIAACLLDDGRCEIDAGRQKRLRVIEGGRA